MAIIKCPECNGDISTSAPKCVHCGAKITFCPECETASIGELSVCPTCGYVFAKKPPETMAAPENAEDTLEKIIKKWGTESLVRKIVDNTFFSVIISCVPYIFYLLAGLKLTGDAFELLDSINTITFYLIIGTILLWVTDFLSEFLSNYYQYENLCIWAEGRKLDLIGVIKKDLSLDFSKANPEVLVKESVFRELIVTALFFNKNVQDKSAKLSFEIKSGILTAVQYMFTLLFVIPILEDSLHQIAIWGSDNFELDLSSISGWWMIAVALIAYVSKKIYSKIFEKRIDTKIDEWIKKEMPDNAENYNKYVKGAVSYFEDKKTDNLGKDL